MIKWQGDQSAWTPCTKSRIKTKWINIPRTISGTSYLLAWFHRCLCTKLGKNSQWRQREDSKAILMISLVFGSTSLDVAGFFFLHHVLVWDIIWPSVSQQCLPRAERHVVRSWCVSIIIYNCNVYHIKYQAPPSLLWHRTSLIFYPSNLEMFCILMKIYEGGLAL